MEDLSRVRLQHSRFGMLPDRPSALTPSLNNRDSARRAFASQLVEISHNDGDPRHPFGWIRKGRRLKLPAPEPLIRLDRVPR